MTTTLLAAAPGIAVPAPRDDLCLDFANTRYWRGSDPATETLSTPAALLDWMESTGNADPTRLAALRERWRGDPEAAARAFVTAIRLRESVNAVFSATATGSVPAPVDLAAVNDALARSPARSRLDLTGDRFAWRVVLPPGLEGLLVPVLWSAGDLLAGPRLARVRQCANDRCRWLFLDDSKSANRRWCSMSQCGNRAKARRHYVKRKLGGP